MSVAFRRESDEEHLEPRFELPIPPGPNLVTPRGLAQIEARVAELEQAVAAAAAAEPEERKRALRYWRQRLATAQLAPPPPADEAGFGSRVTFLLNRERRSITIVGDDEAEPTAGLIAFSAPLARALIGAGEGDRVAFGGRADAIELLSIDG
ncbi:GreA/GreB family elongation factor [Sphingomonas nostoxanthinifaciens]|uniref:GreA/GreB family elongation factor n=1 Tax=Sphingomonas nostoxanthinifaciens TaxID=2872652 RepID=UPI001CC1C7D4|nr:GreA/GreB family elongation factor [Sphingomonas nostoxanthinifaciens]UAK24127.1 GreA/GreB family elongation factor [Sphingomonas nostoxanthinifaciens]